MLRMGVGFCMARLFRHCSSLCVRDWAIGRMDFGFFLGLTFRPRPLLKSLQPNSSSCNVPAGTIKLEGVSGHILVYMESIADPRLWNPNF